MLKVGLTGGYASGKSLVAQQLEALGCHVIYADALGHQVLAPTGEAYAPVIALFGPAILNADQTINRKELGKIVFNSPEVLQQLNSIVHPAVFKLEEQAIAEFKTEQPKGIAVVEAAILIETGRYKHFDRLIVTSCRPEIQIARAVERDHISQAEAESRLARQLSDAERTRFADYIIDTNGSREETTKQIEKIYVQLRQLAEAASS